MGKLRKALDSYMDRQFGDSWIGSAYFITVDVLDCVFYFPVASLAYSLDVLSGCENSGVVREFRKNREKLESMAARTDRMAYKS